MWRVSVLSTLSVLIVTSFGQQVLNDPVEIATNETKNDLGIAVELRNVGDKINPTQPQETFFVPRQTDKELNFYVITRDNPRDGKRLLVGDAGSLRETGFNPDYPTRILVHGWMGNRDSIVNRLVSEAYLRRGDYNLIVMDWSVFAGTLDYSAARRSISKVAPNLTDLVDFLSLHGNTQPSDVYLIGHSLGAHLVGAAARKVRSGRVGVIVALDAALPLFVNKFKDRVSTSDANYVLSIHTNGGQIGIYEPLGHAAFYPNWGRIQPGCETDLFGGCSHFRSVEYFAESLEGEKSMFASQDCQKFFSILKKQCPGTSDPVYMGGDPINTAHNGVFHLKTKSTQPFALPLS